MSDIRREFDNIYSNRTNDDKNTDPPDVHSKNGIKITSTESFK